MTTDEREEQTILAAFAVLDGAELGGAGTVDESEETIGRLYVEVLGLLAYQETAAAPSPAFKQRLMTALAGDQAGEVRPLRKPVDEVAFTLTDVDSPQATAPTEPAALRSRRLPKTPRLVPIPVEDAAPLRREAALPPAGSMTRPRVWSRPVALAAAALILALLGVDAWLTDRFLTQRDTIAQLSDQLLNERGERIRRSTLAATAVHELNEMRRKFSLVTSREVLAAGLKPMGTPLALQPGAHGVIFIAADHQHWYLAVEGLSPSSTGVCYQVWFVTAEGPRTAGTFHVNSTAPVELSSAQMPAGTREVWITVEPAAGSQQPTGPQVLAGAQFQTL